MRALITGITGQDGSYLAEFLLDKGYDVYGLVRRTSTPNTANIAHILLRLTLIQGDMLDQSSLAHALEVAEPDEVYNLAAMSHVGTSFKVPVATAEINALGPLRLLGAIRNVNEHIKFYQASTSELFGNAQNSRQNEDTPFFPVSPYGTSKLFAHTSVSNFRANYGMFCCSGILFNHESPRRGLDFVTRKITHGVARIKMGLQDTIEMGNLSPRRDWGYAGDYVEAMWLMLQQKDPQDFVIATGENHSVGEFVGLACQEAGLPYSWPRYIETKGALFRASEVHALRGDASKAERVLGWKPRVSFPELVSMMVKHDLALLGGKNENQSNSSTCSSTDSLRGLLGV